MAGASFYNHLQPLDFCRLFLVKTDLKPQTLTCIKQSACLDYLHFPDSRSAGFYLHLLGCKVRGKKGSGAQQSSLGWFAGLLWDQQMFRVDTASPGQMDGLIRGYVDFTSIQLPFPVCFLHNSDGPYDQGISLLPLPLESPHSQLHEVLSAMHRPR